MKVFLSFVVSLLFLLPSQAQTVGIGTTTPHASAQLDISSSSKGFLPPRMTGAQRDAIVNPPAGLMIWCTNCSLAGEMQVFNGSQWTNMIGATKSETETQICNQRWKMQNLDVTTYRNGDPIPKVTDNAAWSALSTGAYCYYNNDSATYAAIYGKLYNWYAVTDPRGLAPAGFHVPSEAEWVALETCLGGTSAAGGALKDTGILHWQTLNVGATNSSGFTARPAGVRSFDGSFYFIIIYGTWWSSTASGSVDARFRRLSYATTLVFDGSQNRRDAYSVRVLRD